MNKTKIMLEILFGLLICSIMFLLVYSATIGVAVICEEYKQVPVRYEGTGGLFGGTTTVETTKENMDTYKKRCIKGIDLWGNPI